MRGGHGFALLDLVAVLAVGVIAGSVGVVCARPDGVMIPVGLKNLQQMAVATGMYRNDNNGYFPITYTYHPRGNGQLSWGQVAGWCTWSHLGKNNDRYWYSGYGGVFDVEAADRPLNGYVDPGNVFKAPPAPERLPPNAPERLQEGFKFRDPGDITTHQRQWPNSTPGVSAYDDVGASYHWNAAWWQQPALASFQPFGGYGTPSNRMYVGTQWLATGYGLDPAKFVWMGDEIAGLIPFLWTGYQIPSGYGGFNNSVLLYYDGHAGFETMIAGNNQQAFITPKYHLWFVNP